MFPHHHTLGCGCGMNGLGQLTGPGPAGEVQAVQTVAQQVRNLTSAINRALPGARFDRSAFQNLLRRIEADEVRQFTREDSKNFILGTAGKMIDAVAQARQLASINVPDDSARERNRAAQNAMLGPAALLGDKALAVFRDMRPVRGGTSGLGQVGLWEVPLAAWVVGGVVIAVLGTAAIAALSVYVDADRRLTNASDEAARICSTASPPCSADDRARIVRSLSGGGPAEAAARAVGEAIGDAAKILIIGGVSATAIYVWWSLRSRAAERSRRRAAEEYFK
jgi:hypothetical protein